MADHPEITPDELAVALDVFLRTGSYSEAARAIKRDVSAVRRGLLRHPSEPIRAKVYARELERACASTARAVTRTAAQLRADAKTAKPSARADTAFALNDAARTLNAMRTAHAKLIGAHAAEKHQIDVTKLPDNALDAELHALATVVVDARAEGAAGAAPAREEASGDGACGEGDDAGEAPEP